MFLLLGIQLREEEEAHKGSQQHSTRERQTFANERRVCYYDAYG